MNLKNTKVLVTGAGGFIGSHLVEELVQKDVAVKAMVRYNSRNDWGLLEALPPDIKKNIEVIAGDVRDSNLIQKVMRDCRVVFHLAALIAIPYSYRAPASYVETNIFGTLNVMQAALDSGVEKVVHTSTSEVYGTARYAPIDEQHPLQGQSPYSASKIGADKMVESFHLSFGLPVATIRPFNAFGPRQSARAIIPTIISQAFCKDRIEVGLLSAERDFTFVKDTVDGFIRIAENDHTIGETINIGSGKCITIDALAQTILQELNSDAKVVTVSERVRPENSEVMKLVCDNHKAQQIMQWRPETGLKQGLKETIAFCSNHEAFYKTDIYNV